MQPLQPEALVQEEPQESRDLSKLEQKIKDVEEVPDNKVSIDKVENTPSPVDSSSEESDEEEKTVHIKMPLELDFDDLAGALMEKNQRSRMNCIVEKKRAEQVVDHQPKTIQLPFGLNITTDPRFEHLSGERMAIFCESGNDQRHQEPEPEEQEETIMIQPIMIPIPHTNFQTHMPMQMQPQMIPNNIPNSMPNGIPNGIPHRIPMQQQQPPMHPMETMRPPMPMSMMPPQQQQPPQEPEFPPVQMLHRIAQQIIAQRLQMEQAAKNQDDSQSNEVNQSDEDQPQEGQHFDQPEFMMARGLPIPEEVLSQINRLPNSDVIVAVGQDHDEQNQEQQHEMQQHEMQQQVDNNEHPVNIRIGYGRQLPELHENIPLRMVQIQPESQPATDEMRPHYLHPRSVRSVDNIVPKKRVKRCSCDCAC
ncbi:hypothetical protein AMK59_2824 [Oryctes borbonicus]|uniref:Uncharacterized protein n=1 Tax=Oryctes borbonicus TaxID=1629725 RepID=A0A0T6BGB9_9SCAR|nr:hypothetical protein AMK59_2824 [Oryctes borbonicus]